MPWSRRAVLLASLSGLGVLAHPLRAEDEPGSLAGPEDLKPGGFSWHPERAPSGPVVVVVSIPGQWAAVYRNGVRIGLSTCSTGKPGHGTPAGVFLILQKDVHHRSKTYGNAPMPYSERLTWDGVALHAGALPGYPSSHGCVHLPLDFARLLFGVTHVGTPVILADKAMVVRDLASPGLEIAGPAEDEARAATAAAGRPAPAADAAPAEATAVSALVSTRHNLLRILENGEVTLQVPVTIREPDLPFGTHVFVLSAAAAGAAPSWMAVGLGAEEGEVQARLIRAATLDRVSLSQEASAEVYARLHAGSTLVLTDQPLDGGTSSGPGFRIVNGAESS